MDEATIIKECVSGNPKAQKLLYDTFSNKMMAVCLRYANSTEEAEDVLQEGSIKIFQHIQNFKQEGSLEGWIRKIMVNCALDAYRKNKKHSENLDIDRVGFALGEEAVESDHLQAADLMKLLNALPQGYKVIFNMFAIEGYSHKEIAESLGITVSTSKSQFSRARTFLQKRLEKIEQVSERE